MEDLQPWPQVSWPTLFEVLEEPEGARLEDSCAHADCRKEWAAVLPVQTLSPIARTPLLVCNGDDVENLIFEKDSLRSRYQRLASSASSDASSKRRSSVIG